MSRKDLIEHLAGIVKEAQDGLERFKTAIAQGAFPKGTTSVECVTSQSGV